MTAVETSVEKAAVSATGGSARSQLDQLQERSWKPHPLVSLTIVGAAFGLPVLSAIAVVQVAARTFGRPPGVVGLIVFLAALVVLATAVLWAVDRLSRRLLPLAAMLRLSLVFPDRAPSRFSVALKTGSGKALERSLQRTATRAEFATTADDAARVVGLISNVSAHDRLTRGHCERVRAYADLIAAELGLDAESRNKLHWAALLHDVGKLDVPAAVLNKTERLTSQEWDVIRGHPAAAEKWLVPLRPWLGDWTRAATEHHERYDGDGYPNRLAGTDISTAGRIVAVADAFDVMTAARSYKKAYPAEQARAELANNAGTQFDPTVVRAFLAISLGRLRLVMGPLAWLSGLSGLFSVGSIGTAAGVAVTAAAAAVTGLAAPAAAHTTDHSHRATGTAQITTTTLAGSPGASLGSENHAPLRGLTSPGGTTAPPPGTNSRPGTGTGSAPGAPTKGTPTIGGRTGGQVPPSRTTTTTTPVVVPLPNPTPITTPITTPVTTPVTTPITTPGTTTATSPPTPHAPVANPDTTSTLLTAHVLIDVLANDTDVDNNLDPSTLTLITLPSGGYQSITVSNGKIDVVVNALYIGTLHFTYRICDTTNLCAQTTVAATFAL